MTAVVEKKKSALEMIRKIGWQLTEHDILNQINKIGGFSDLMLKTNSYSWEKEWAEFIRLSSIKLKNLIRLAGSYIEFDERTKNISVSKSFREAVSFYPELKKKAIFSDNCGRITVKAHESILTHILYNLIHNSERYAGKKLLKIKIDCLQAEDKTLIVYQDSGIGIKKADKKRIFERGYSEGSSTGLGLFLIQQFCNFYGWEISEEGEAGKGVKFVIAIPN